MNFVDTHCHIHEAQYELAGDNSVRAMWLRANKPDPDDMIRDAKADGVTHLICVGTSLADSKLAVEFVQSRPGTWASIGLHPHEAKEYTGNKKKLEEFESLITRQKVVAVGECGLDYYYSHSPKTDQKDMLRFQIELALKHDLPLIFHVRDAFEDFWQIFDEYKGLRGVVHSFSATRKELDQALERGLYVGLNGIMTFTKNPEQLEAAKKAPSERILMETDSPFLTPVPFRGTICLPKHVRVTAEFLSDLRAQPLEELAVVSTRNAKDLFNI